MKGGEDKGHAGLRAVGKAGIAPTGCRATSSTGRDRLGLCCAFDNSKLRREMSWMLAHADFAEGLATILE